MKYLNINNKLIFAALVSLFILLSNNIFSSTHENNRLKVGFTSAIDNFDPHWNQLMAYQNLIAQNVFDHLTIIDTEMKVKPGLAKKWEISSDEKQYIFYLREKAKFHNGRNVTADDVVYSFKRTIDQKTTFASKMDPIANIEAIGKYQVKMVLKKPVAPWLEEVSLIAIVPIESESKLKNAPIGSGPFKFKEWKANDKIVLIKNDDYDLKNYPLLDKIEFKLFPSMPVALANLDSGDVDAVFEVPISDAERFKGRNDINFIKPPSSNSIFVIEIAKNRYEPLKNKDVREAIFTCMDKKSIQKVAYFGEGDIQWSPLPKSSWAYFENQNTIFDINKAKKLLKKANYSNLNLTIDIISGVAVMENIATVWQENLSKCGVKLEIIISDVSAWLDKYVNRNYQLIANWANYKSDPHGIFDVMFAPHWKDENSFPNRTLLNKVSEAASISDIDARRNIYKDIQSSVISDFGPVVTVQSQPLISLTNKKVHNWEMNAMNYIFFNSIYKK